ncbi:GntR family transcriptional regulator [Nonomuraea sp. K274]|uniref:GntR family transcriptional regulator n=1 Tax=Nonomuraea cypriaca TaxID=1187855 RepID=A0A931A8J3_9ACTN|nr:GntR family transcriptional regulator [Nonomuraea cypriaca]MBF8186975.1 GntR family transcriptional regulator [Nonomuraea cypriaca]
MPSWSAARVRELILCGDLPPGSRLGEAELSERFGVSRPSLREGLRSLGTEGLVVQIPRRGTFVRTVTLQDAYEIFTLREEPERMAIRLGVPVQDNIAMGRCRSAMDRLEEAATTGDSAGVTEEGFAFHLALVGGGLGPQAAGALPVKSAQSREGTFSSGTRCAHSQPGTTKMIQVASGARSTMLKPHRMSPL